MKQFTSIEQTAKLIDLGVEKPKSMNGEHNGWQFMPTPAYSIGELIEMLPTDIIAEETSCSRVIDQNDVMYYSFLLDTVGCICNDSTELIDNLYDMVIKLKEGGE